MVAQWTLNLQIRVRFTVGELLDSSVVERYTHCVAVPGSIPGSASHGSSVTERYTCNVAVPGLIPGRGFTFAQGGLHGSIPCRGFKKRRFN